MLRHWETSKDIILPVRHRPLTRKWVVCPDCFGTGLARTGRGLNKRTPPCEACAGRGGHYEDAKESVRDGHGTY